MILLVALINKSTLTFMAIIRFTIYIAVCVRKIIVRTASV